MRPNESPIPIIEELTWRGPWSAVAAYELGDAVVYQGSTWLAVAPSVNVAPPTLPTESNASWHLMAKLGSTGPAGATGPAGPAGPQGNVGPAGPQGNVGPQGPQGNIGPQGPQGNIGPAGPQGDIGPQGQEGDVGPQGPAGTPGEVWFSGSGAPAGGTGIVGDWYVNLDNGDVYEKTGAAAWTLRGNIRGPQGIQGIQGDPGPAGADGAPGADGTDGVGVPAGGAINKVLKKASAADFDTVWGDASTVAALDDLTDVDLTGAADGQYLKRASGVWVPASVPAGPTVVLKTADESRTSTVTVTNDNHFFFSALANTKYLVKLYLFHSGPSAANIKFRWGIPAGVTGNHSIPQEPGGSTGGGLATELFITTNTSGIPRSHLVLAYISVGGTAGTINFRWAQNASNGTACNILTGSIMEYQVVA
jgi:hypothetical protein